MTRLNPFGRHAWGTAPWGPTPFEADFVSPPVPEIDGHFIPFELAEHLRRRAARPKKRIVLEPEVQRFGDYRIISF